MDKETLRRLAQELQPELVRIRRALHRIPELAGQEYETQAFLCDQLQQLGISHRKVAETGVCAVIRGAKPGKTVALRGDMDALEVEETTGVPYRSVHAGRMHACGHDAHMTFVLGAAMVLHRMRDALCGNVVLLFQPAEERGGGAQRMIEAGVLNDPEVDAAFGIHVWPLPYGTIAARQGPVMACPDIFRITVKGKGGHGAAPQLAHSPITPLCAIGAAVNALVAQEIDPLGAAVVSVCNMHAGDTYNVIPPEGYLEGTIRTYEGHVRSTIHKRLLQITEQISAAYETSGSLTIGQNAYPATVNDSALAAWAGGKLREIYPQDCVREQEPPSMTGEDFGFFAQKVPSVFLWLGVSSEAEGCHYELHHPCFTIDERALADGVCALCHLATQFTET